MDEVLQNKVYPLLRVAFTEEASSGGIETVPKGSLCVYDSIFVRYNGDTAVAAGRVGASQPLVSGIVCFLCTLLCAAMLS